MPAFRLRLRVLPRSFNSHSNIQTSYYNYYATLEARIPLHSLMIGFISQCLQRATFKVDSKGVSRGDGSDASPTREVLKASRPQALVSGFFTLDHRFWPGYLSFSIQYLGTHCPPWISYIYDIDFYCPCKPERSDLIEVDEVRWGKVRYRPTQVLRIHIILYYDDFQASLAFSFMHDERSSGCQKNSIQNFGLFCISIPTIIVLRAWTVWSISLGASRS